MRLLAVFIVGAVCGVGLPVLAQHEHGDDLPVCAQAVDLVTLDKLNTALRRIRTITAALSESESQRTGEPAAAIRERVEKGNP